MTWVDLGRPKLSWVDFGLTWVNLGWLELAWASGSVTARPRPRSPQRGFLEGEPFSLDGSLWGYAPSLNILGEASGVGMGDSGGREIGMNINRRAQTEPGRGPWRPRRPPGCRCEVVLAGMRPGCGPGLQEPPSLSVAHAGSARHVPDTQAAADTARARFPRSCCPCEGNVQRPGAGVLGDSQWGPH